MKLKRVSIKNFRKLADIEFDISSNLSVIVGPNAIGKSSIFEAIRLAKAILFPRMQDELRNVLIGLGASSAHFFNGQLSYDVSALAGDANKPVLIALTIELSTAEIESVGRSRSTIARSLIAAQLGRSVDDPTLDLRAYFSTPLGQQAEREAIRAVDEAYGQIEKAKGFNATVEITSERLNSSSAIFSQACRTTPTRMNTALPVRTPMARTPRNESNGAQFPGVLEPWRLTTSSVPASTR